MLTSSTIHLLFNTFLFLVDIRNSCFFIAPLFASIKTITAYFFLKEDSGRKVSGLLAALLIAIVSGYISRLDAGSYDNEAVAITALIMTFYFYKKSFNIG